MFHRLLLAAGVAVVLASPARAASPDEIAALRAEFERKFQSLQADYEARLKALESRVQTAEIKADNAQQDAAANASPPPVSAGAFNPEVSLILQGAYIDRAGGERPITGFMPVERARARRARLHAWTHTELVVAANVDPYSRGLRQSGAGRRGGRGRGSLVPDPASGSRPDGEGWPLPVRHRLPERKTPARLGFRRQQPDVLGAVRRASEAGRPADALAGADRAVHGSGRRSRQGTVLPRLGRRRGQERRRRLGRLCPCRWRCRCRAFLARRGVLPARAAARARGVSGRRQRLRGADRFSGHPRPGLATSSGNGRPTATRSSAISSSRRSISIATKTAICLCEDNTGGRWRLHRSADRYASAQSGGYVQAVYQFMPRWRTGLRYDRLHSGSVDFGANQAFLRRRPISTRAAGA